MHTKGKMNNSQNKNTLWKYIYTYVYNMCLYIIYIRRQEPRMVCIAQTGPFSLKYRMAIYLICSYDKVMFIHIFSIIHQWHWLHAKSWWKQKLLKAYAAAFIVYTVPDTHKAEYLEMRRRVKERILRGFRWGQEKLQNTQKHDFSQRCSQMHALCGRELQEVNTVQPKKFCGSYYY